MTLECAAKGTEKMLRKDCIRKSGSTATSDNAGDGPSSTRREQNGRRNIEAQDILWSAGRRRRYAEKCCDISLWLHGQCHVPRLPQCLTSSHPPRSGRRHPDSQANDPLAIRNNRYPRREKDWRHSWNAWLCRCTNGSN